MKFDNMLANLQKKKHKKLNKLVRLSFTHKSCSAKSISSETRRSV